MNPTTLYIGCADGDPSADEVTKILAKATGRGVRVVDQLPDDLARLDPRETERLLLDDLAAMAAPARPNRAQRRALARARRTSKVTP